MDSESSLFEDPEIERLERSLSPMEWEFLKELIKDKISLHEDRQAGELNDWFPVDLHLLLRKIKLRELKSKKGIVLG